MAQSIFDQERVAKERRLNITDNRLDEIERTDASRYQWMLEMQMVRQHLKHFASIVGWIPFNEGWGQFATLGVTNYLKQEPGFYSHFVTASSGWNEVDGIPGDVQDVHNYEQKPFNVLSNTFKHYPFPAYGRARVLGEFGGIAFAMRGHIYSDLEGTWGYSYADSADDFENLLASLIERLGLAVCDWKLSAAVYTQVSDIEGEVNGMLTYDRLPKLPAGTVYRIMHELRRSLYACDWVAYDKEILEPAIDMSMFAGGE